MTAEPIPADIALSDAVPLPDGTFYVIAERDEAGHPIRLTRMHDVAVVRGADGTALGLSIGCHPSRGAMALSDVLYVPAEPEQERRAHACAMLADLDCYAAAGDHKAAALARWHEAHPDGPTTPAEAVEEQAIRAGFMKR